MYAGFWLRLKAFAVDYLLIFGYLLLVLIVSLFLIPSLQDLFQASQLIAQLTGFLLVTFPVSLYFIITDSRIGKGTFGKWKMRIRVVDANNRSISVSHAIFRTALKFLPWEMSHFMAYRMIYLGDGDLHLLDYLDWGIDLCLDPAVCSYGCLHEKQTVALRPLSENLCSEIKFFLKSIDLQERTGRIYFNILLKMLR